MKITVKVHPKSSRNMVKKISNLEFAVYTNAPAEKNRANEAAVGLLARYFEVPKSAISILAGHSSRSKIVEIL